MTPAAVHFGRAPSINEQRRRILQAAYGAHPQRFKGRIPVPPAMPQIVGINLPESSSMENTDDMTQTTALLTNPENKASQSH
jgi:putative transposase